MTSRFDRAPLEAEFVGGPIDGLRYVAVCEERLPASLHMPCDGVLHLYEGRVGESGRPYYWHRGPLLSERATT